MPPPQLDVGSFFQFADYIISTKLGLFGTVCYQEYYRLMRTCFSQYTVEGHIFRWLKDDENNHLPEKPSSKVCMQYTPQIFDLFIKTCQDIGAQFLQVRFIYPLNLNGPLSSADLLVL